MRPTARGGSRTSDRAVRTLAQAAELAPVFGLAGTLISLSQLPAEGLARGALGGAISMAVLTTLYGLLLANCCSPRWRGWSSARPRPKKKSASG